MKSLRIYLAAVLARAFAWLGRWLDKCPKCGTRMIEARSYDKLECPHCGHVERF